MEFNTERDVAILMFGALAGASGMMAYIGFLAAFTDIITYRPWMSFGVDSPLVLLVVGLVLFSLTTFFAWLVPDKDLDDSQSTRVDA